MTRPPMRAVVAGALGLAVAVAGAGCAMRVTGVVRDAATGDAIAGAVLTADDGRNRLSVSDPGGRYSVKTDWRNATLTVSARGYQTATVSVPGLARHPVVDVDLQPDSVGARATGRAPVPTAAEPATRGSDQ